MNVSQMPSTLQFQSSGVYEVSDSCGAPSADCTPLSAAQPAGSAAAHGCPAGLHPAAMATKLTAKAEVAAGKVARMQPFAGSAIHNRLSTVPTLNCGAILRTAASSRCGLCTAAPARLAAPPPPRLLAAGAGVVTAAFSPPVPISDHMRAMRPQMCSCFFWLEDCQVIPLRALDIFLMYPQLHHVPRAAHLRWPA
jgi:hypothetical protein